jgi:peptidoglycan/LPS O-acetylase OafA/YrhL
MDKLRNSSATKIWQLDALRGILSLWVLLEHVRLFSPIKTSASFENMIWAGNAVDVFIILSGFVITLLLNKSSTIQIPKFWVQRFFRLWPVFVVCFLASLLVPLEKEPESWPIAIVSNLTMLHGIVPESICKNVSTSILPPSWSISLEWQFYIFAPFFISALSLKKWWVVPCIFLSILCAAMWSTSSFVYPSFLPIKLHLFLIGIACFYIKEFLADVGFVFSTPHAVIATALVFAVTQKISLAIWFIVFVTMIPGNIASATESLRNTLLGKSLRWIGSISYPVYLCHWPILMFINGRLNLKELLRSEQPAMALMVSCLVITFLTILLAFIMHKFIENPGIRLGRILTTDKPSRVIRCNQSEKSRR